MDTTNGGLVAVVLNEKAARDEYERLRDAALVAAGARPHPLYTDRWLDVPERFNLKTEKIAAEVCQRFNVTPAAIGLWWL